MSTQALFAVPVVDVRSLQCDTIAVGASCEAEAVWIALRHAAQLRYTGGKIERIEVNPEMSVTWDPWAKRYLPERLKETAT
jgi:hypothetical protein